MESNLDQVFELVKEEPKQVIIKVNADDPLTVALFPFVSSDMAYITVTRGKNHTLTAVKKDGKTWGFNWGESGYTLISNNMERLKKAVIDFIEEYCHILLERDGWQIKEAHIFYNSNFNKWQLTLEGRDRNGYHDAHWWSKTAKSFEEMATDIIPYIHCCGWEPYTATTGIKCWKAILD